MILFHCQKKKKKILLPVQFHRTHTQCQNSWETEIDKSGKGRWLLGWNMMFLLFSIGSQSQRPGTQDFSHPRRSGQAEHSTEDNLTLSLKVKLSPRSPGNTPSIHAGRKATYFILRETIFIPPNLTHTFKGFFDKERIHSPLIFHTVFPAHSLHWYILENEYCAIKLITVNNPKFGGWRGMSSKSSSSLARAGMDKIQGVVRFKGSRISLFKKIKTNASSFILKSVKALDIVMKFRKQEYSPNNSKFFNSL